MKKKKTLSLVGAAVATAVLVAGCGPTTAGQSSGNTSNTSGTKSSKGGYTIGLSTFFEGNSWQAENISLFKQAADKYKQEGVLKNYIISNANGDTSTQIAQIQDMINEHVSAIVVDANSDTGLNPVLEKAMKAGIPVLNYDSIVTADVTSKINTNQVQWGQITGQWLVKQLNGKGNIIVLNGLAGNPTNNQRYQDAKALFAKTPGIHVLNVQYDSWDQATAQSGVASLLAAYPKIDAVWSQGGAMTAGAMIDFQKAGRPLVPMTGEDYNGYLKMWVKELPHGFHSISPGQPNYLVTMALDAAVDTLQGHPVPKVVNVPLPVITDATVKQYVQPGKSDSYWVLDHIAKSDEDKLLGQKG